MSSERIIEILQDQPELLSTVKFVFVQRLQRLGNQRKHDPWESLDPENITDDAFFSRIQRDTDLRILVSRELVKRGYDEFSDEEPEQSAADEITGTASSHTRRSERSTVEPRRHTETQDPKVVHRNSPYPTLPSLKDLYSQYPAVEIKLKRFGSDTFH